jgi:hypothetical protein
MRDEPFGDAHDDVAGNDARTIAIAVHDCA